MREGRQQQEVTKVGHQLAAEGVSASRCQLLVLMVAALGQVVGTRGEGRQEVAQEEGVEA
jgi:hypothetical protein